MDLVYEFYIGASPAEVWKTIVDAQSVKRVFFDSEIRSTFEVGAPMTYVGPGLDGPETLHMDGKVLAIEAERLFSHTLRVGKVYQKDSERYFSRVTYSLEAIGDATRLKLVHDDWHPEDSTKEANQAGWWRILSQMKSLAETDKVMDLALH